jgi:hypothetical protein
MSRARTDHLVRTTITVLVLLILAAPLLLVLLSLHLGFGIALLAVLGLYITVPPSRRPLRTITGVVLLGPLYLPFYLLGRSRRTALSTPPSHAFGPYGDWGPGNHLWRTYHLDPIALPAHPAHRTVTGR